MTNMSGISILFSKQRPIDPQRKTRLTRTKKERLTLVKILVVEDDRNFNDLIATILRQNGYTVQGAENPPAAYDLLQSEQFDP